MQSLCILKVTTFILNVPSTFMRNSNFLRIRNLDTIQKSKYGRICLHVSYIVLYTVYKLHFSDKNNYFSKNSVTKYSKNIWKFVYFHITCNCDFLVKKIVTKHLFFIKTWFIHYFSCDFHKLFFYDEYLYGIWCMWTRCNYKMDLLLFSFFLSIFFISLYLIFISFYSNTF